jgi:hypothetical protein
VDTVSDSGERLLELVELVGEVARHAVDVGTSSRSATSPKCMPSAYDMTVMLRP